MIFSFEKNDYFEESNLCASEYDFFVQAYGLFKEHYRGRAMKEPFPTNAQETKGQILKDIGI